MTTQVEETGMQRYQRLKAEATSLGITGNMKSDELEKAIAAAKESPDTEPEKGDELATPVDDGKLHPDEAKKIDARLKYEEEAREKFRHERKMTIDRAEIIAESESLCIPIDIPENPTVLQLAKARKTLGMKKKEVKPSPETLAIEAGKRGYYIFTNREQDDAVHTTNLGGKYFITLVPDQVHVLSDFHIKRWRKCAVTPQYSKVQTGVVPGPGTVGQTAEKCIRTGDKPRFAFELLGEAPIDAPFGMVTDTIILDKLLKE
jgi:hypothetical protein